MRGIEKLAGWFLLVCGASHGGVKKTLPSLVGDGVVDDTVAIQARLDSGMGCVYLPPPAKHDLISEVRK